VTAAPAPGGHDGQEQQRPLPGPWRPRLRNQPAPAWLRKGRPGGSALLADWDRLAGPDREHAWASLVEWVSWLHDRYELSAEERLPHCWAAHPGLVEELTALRAWREEIWTSPRPSGQAARYWHAEMRQTITAALTFYAAGCRAGHHAASPATAELRQRWAAASPPGTPPAAPGTGTDWLPGTAMDRHLSAGRAATLSETVTGYLRLEQSWWLPAASGWQRVTDPATAALLSRHAATMAAADQAVRQAAAAQQAAAASQRGR